MNKSVVISSYYYFAALALSTHDDTTTRVDLEFATSRPSTNTQVCSVERVYLIVYVCRFSPNEMYYQITYVSNYYEEVV